MKGQPHTRRVASSRLKRSIVCALAAFVLSAAGAARADNCPARLRVAFGDTPAEPFVRGQGASFATTPGLLVTWTRTALQRLGCLERAEFVRLPSRRVKALIESGEVDLVGGVARGGPVAALLTLPAPTGPRGEFDLSLGRVDFVLYARRGLLTAGVASGPAQVLPSGARVGALAGGRAEVLARERGWPVDPAPSHESSLQKLRAGRTPLLLTHSHFLEGRLASDRHLAREIERFGPAIETLRLQVGALPALAQREPAFLEALWRELCRESAASSREVPGACVMPPSP